MKFQPHDHLGLAQASFPGFCLSHLCSPSSHTPRPSDSVMSSPNLDSDPSPPPCRSSSTLLASRTTARTSAGRLEGLPSNACHEATSLTPLSGSPAEDYRSEGGVSEEGGSRPSGAPAYSRHAVKHYQTQRQLNIGRKSPGGDNQIRNPKFRVT